MHKFFAKTLFLGKNVISLPQCHSTNEEAAKLLSNKNGIEGSIVLTDYQISGKGQRGNVWESERGKNLMVSIILRPKFLSPTAQFLLHTVCSLAIYDALFPLLGNKLKIKWPNDIYYCDKKICGILIENSIRGNSLDSAIVGIGLNVNQLSFSNEKATSLKEIVMEDLDRFDLLESLLLQLEKRYLQLKNNKTQELRTEYLLKLYRLQEAHLYERNGEQFLGEIKGVDEFGRLLIKDSVDVKSYDFKEVKFIAS